MDFGITERRDIQGIRTHEGEVPSKRVFRMIETLLRHGFLTYEIAHLTQAGEKYSLGMQEILANLAVIDKDRTFSIPGCRGYQEREIPRCEGCDKPIEARCNYFEECEKDLEAQAKAIEGCPTCREAFGVE